MEKLQLTIDGHITTIEADLKIVKGIYVATESKIAKRNIEKLRISFDHSLADNIVQNRITKIEKWAFLSSKTADEYLQYIIMPSAELDDFNRFLHEINNIKTKQLLNDTFNLTRLSMDNLDLLGSLGKSKN